MQHHPATSEELMQLRKREGALLPADLEAFRLHEVDRLQEGEDDPSAGAGLSEVALVVERAPLPGI